MIIGYKVVATYKGFKLSSMAFSDKYHGNFSMKYYKKYVPGRWVWSCLKNKGSLAVFDTKEAALSYIAGQEICSEVCGTDPSFEFIVKLEVWESQLILSPAKYNYLWFGNQKAYPDCRLKEHTLYCRAVKLLRKVEHENN